jgi:hypothetical protein
VFTYWPELKASPQYRWVVPDTGQAFLPIIPLMGTARMPVILAPWPRHKLDPEIYRSRIEARFRRILGYEASGGSASRGVAWAIAHFTSDRIANFVISNMKSALAEWHFD